MQWVKKGQILHANVAKAKKDHKERQICFDYYSYSSMNQFTDV